MEDPNTEAANTNALPENPPVDVDTQILQYLLNIDNTLRTLPIEQTAKKHSELLLKLYMEHSDAIMSGQMDVRMNKAQTALFMAAQNWLKATEVVKEILYGTPHQEVQEAGDGEEGNNGGEASETGNQQEASPVNTETKASGQRAEKASKHSSRRRRSFSPKG